MGTDTKRGIFIMQDDHSNINNNNIIKAGLGYLIGNILIKGLTFLTIPLFTRIMDIDSYGIFTSYMSFEAILTIILSLGLDGSIRNAKIDFQAKMDNFISSVVSMTFIPFVISSLIINIMYAVGYDFFGFGIVINNILIIHSFASALIIIFTVKLSVDYKYKQYLIISIFNAILSVVLSTLLIVLVMPNTALLGRVIGVAAPMVIVAMIVLMNIANKSNFSLDLIYWKYSIVIGFPFLVHKLSHIILSQFDRIMIAQMVGFAQAGIYGVAYGVGSIFHLIWNATDTAWTPWVYEQLNNRSFHILKKASKQYLIFMTLVLICLMSISIDIYKIMVTESYYSGTSLVIPISASIYLIFVYSFYVQIENFNKKAKYSAIGTGIAAIINVLLNLIAINLFGYYAAAYTTVLTYFLLLVFHRISTINILKYNLGIEKYIVIGVISVAFISMGMLFFQNNWFLRWSVGFISGIFVLNYIIKYFMKRGHNI